MLGQAKIAVELRDELLNGEIFYSLKEAQIVIEHWRQHFNTIKAHSGLNYRLPAPQTFADGSLLRCDHATQEISIPPVQKNRPGHSNWRVLPAGESDFFGAHAPSAIKPVRRHQRRRSSCLSLPRGRLCWLDKLRQQRWHNTHRKTNCFLASLHGGW